MGGKDGTPGTRLPSSSPPARTERGLGISSAGVFLISVFIQFVGFIASFFLAHIVGVDDAGKALLGFVQLSLLIGSSINSLADLRLGSAFTFFVSRGIPPERSLGTYLLIRLTLVGLAGLAIVLVAPYPLFGFGALASSPQELAVLLAFAALPLVWSIPTVYSSLWVAKGDSVRAQLPLLVESVVRTPLLIFVAYVDPTILTITYAYLAGAAVSAIICIPAIAGRFERFRSTELRAMLRYAWPLMGSLLLFYLVTASPQILVNAYLGTTNLNIFLVANGFRILLLALPAAVALPLFPYIASRHAQRDYETVRSGTWRALRYTALLLIPGVVALVVYRVNFLYILTNGTYVAPAALPLAILAVSAVPLALSQIISTSLSACGRQRLELYLGALQVVVLFGVALGLLSTSLLPISAGLNAISVAVLLSALAAIGLNAFFMERLLAVRIQPLSIGRIVVSSAASFEAVAILNDYLPINRLYQLVIGVGIGFVVYFMVLSLLGELSRQDVRELGGSLGVPDRVTLAVARLCWKEGSPDVNALGSHPAPALRPIDFVDTFSGESEYPSLAPAPPDESPRDRGPG